MNQNLAYLLAALLLCLAGPAYCLGFLAGAIRNGWINGFTAWETARSRINRAIQ